jgi:hypothetical protein
MLNIMLEFSSIFFHISCVHNVNLCCLTCWRYVLTLICFKKCDCERNCRQSNWSQNFIC